MISTKKFNTYYKVTTGQGKLKVIINCTGKRFWIKKYLSKYKKTGISGIVLMFIIFMHISALQMQCTATLWNVHGTMSLYRFLDLL